VITDLCILRPEPGSNELTVHSVHPGISHEMIRKKTGWAIRFSGRCGETAEPTTQELEVLRDLQMRSALAHGGAESAA
jgi:glutaconate CoA-transferase subunit B